MSVTASDLVVYASANMPTGNDATSGGAINTSTKMTFTDMANTTGLVMSSNGDSDSLQVTVTGRNAGGSVVTDTFLIHNTLLRVTGDNEIAFERVLRFVESSGSHTGIITIEQDDGPTWTNIATMENGIDNVYRPFYGVSSSTDGDREFFEKVFVKNNNDTNNLLSAVISESGETDLGSDKVTFDLANEQNDSATTTNRRTPPSAGSLLSGSTGSWDDNDKAVPSTDLGTGSGIGVWVKLTLPESEAAKNGVWTLQIDGNTT